jgi:hypothetical protein
MSRSAARNVVCRLRPASGRVSGQLMADRRIALALRPILPVADLNGALRDLRTPCGRVTLNKAESHSAMKSAP